MNTQLVLTILELVLKYGLPAVQKIVEQWQAEGKETITLADIEALKTSDDIKRVAELAGK